MSTFLPLVSTFGAVAELLQLLAGLALLSMGLQTARSLLDILDRALAAARWLAGLVQLLTMLLLSVIGDLAPVVGRYAGRAAGTTVRLGRQARRWYDRHAAPTVAAADYTARQFVAAQLGTTCPQLQQAIAPAMLLSLCIDPSADTAEVAPEVVTVTRRQLLAIARERHLPRYSRLSTDALREALTV